MISKENYEVFQSGLEPIVKGTFVPTPNQNDLIANHYFIQNGLWGGTEKFVYVYDKRKIDSHKKALLSLCKKLPKFHKPTDQHAGTISCFDLLMDYTKDSSLSQDDVFHQLILTNHFANLLSATNIAKIQPASAGSHNAFLLIIDVKYRNFMERDGQEPADD